MTDKRQLIDLLHYAIFRGYCNDLNVLNNVRDFYEMYNEYFNEDRIRCVETCKGDYSYSLFLPLDIPHNIIHVCKRSKFCNEMCDETCVGCYGNYPYAAINVTFTGSSVNNVEINLFI